MNDLNDFFKMMADGKKTDPVALRAREIKENIQGDLGSLFSDISNMKETDPKSIETKELKNHVKESAQSDMSSLFAELSALRNKKQEIIELIPDIVKIIEEPIIEDIGPSEVPSLINQKPAEDLDKFKDVKKYLGKAKPTHIDPQLDTVAQEFKSITEKIRFLEQSITKIVNTGPGGGEVNFRYLDDVDRSTIVDGNFLTYNTNSKKFEFRESSISGTTQLNFGSSNKTSEVIITGVSITLPTSRIIATMRLEATSDHSIDDLQIDPIRILVKELVTGIGFTIYGEMDNATANGLYKVDWFLSNH